MGAFIPKWRPLDAVNSARLLSARPDEGGVAALCVSPTLAGSAEAATLAIDLTGSWAAAGLRVLLADGTVGTPSLHVPFGLPNDGGLADVLLAGHRWEGLTQPTGTPGLRLLPAGGGSGSTAPQDALQHLAGLCADARAEGTLLVLFVPLGSMVTEWVFGQCTDIVVLSTEGENLQPFFDQDEHRIRALLGRPAGWQASAAPSASAVEPAMDEPRVRPGVESAQRPRPPQSKQAPTPGESEPGAAPARPERRPAALPGNPPPTARIEAAWAQAAAQLRANLEDDPEADADPAPPSEPQAIATPPAKDTSPAAPPAPSPVAKGPPPSEPVTQAAPHRSPWPSRPHHRSPWPRRPRHRSPLRSHRRRRHRRRLRLHRHLRSGRLPIPRPSRCSRSPGSRFPSRTSPHRFPCWRAGIRSSARTRPTIGPAAPAGGGMAGTASWPWRA